MSSSLKLQFGAVMFACILQGLSVMALAKPNGYEAYRAGKFVAWYDLAATRGFEGGAQARKTIAICSNHHRRIVSRQNICIQVSDGA